MFFVSFQNITVKIAVACSVTPYSLVEINQSFKETCFLYLKYSTIAATLNMEATGSPETLVNLYTTIWRHIPEALVVRKKVIATCEPG